MTNQAFSQHKQEIKKAPIMAAFMLAVFINSLNETALNVALSTLMDIFTVNESTIQWLTTGYLLTQGILVPLSAIFLKWYSTRQLFTTAVVFSVIGSLICALSGSFEILLVGRILQAIGSALVLPLMFNTVLFIFPKEKRGSILGFVTLVFTSAPAIGPTVAGLIIGKLNWHWIFWFSFIFLIISFFVGLKFMKNISEVTKPKFDIFSVLFSTLGFGGIVFSLSKFGESAGSFSLIAITSLVVGLVSLMLFAVRQFRLGNPLLNLRTFKFPMFVLGTCLVFASKTIMLSTMLILPMYLIRVGGMSTLTAALVLLPGGFILAILSPFVGKIFDKIGPKPLVIPGLIFASISLWFLMGINPNTSTGTIIFLHSLLMFGTVLIWMPGQTNGLNQLTQDLYPDGSAIMNTLLQIAGATGMAISASLITIGTSKFSQLHSVNITDQLALSAGIQSAFTFVFIVSVISLILGLFVKHVKH